MVNAPSRQELDRMLSDAFAQLRSSLDNVSALKRYLDMAPDVFFTSPDNGYAYDPADLTTIRASLVSLDKLRSISDGGATQATAANLWADAVKIAGFRPVRR